MYTCLQSTWCTVCYYIIRSSLPNGTVTLCSHRHATLLEFCVLFL
uniref:Uncharacterized protein n=1 Tax=Anguilla anguilla TaxID=7936 RepID=A0A0E9PQW8_ANGAN